MGSDSSSRLRPGTRVARFGIEEMLGEGSTGEVYRAFDPWLSRSVALKRLCSDAASREELRHRFRREARAVARVRHPAIVQIYDLVHVDDGPEAEGAGEWLVMELAEGRSLKDLVDEGPLEEALALSIAIELCCGLRAAHLRGLIHRDLKSDNVIVSELGESKILDFGLVKEPVADDKVVTRMGQLVGTPRCMAPEHVRGAPADQRSDLFAFGVLLYEMLTGLSPFDARSPLEAVSKVCRVDPPAPSTHRPGLSPELDGVVAGCLEKDPDERFQTAEEILRRLQAVALDAAASAVERGESTPGVVPLFLPPKPAKPEKPPEPAEPPGSTVLDRAFSLFRLGGPADR